MTETGELNNLLIHTGGSVYRLARIAMLRALELQDGRKPLVAFDSSEKVATIALREIAEGKISYKEGFIREVEGDQVDEVVAK